MPLQRIQRVEKVGKKKRQGARYFIELTTKELVVLRFAILKSSDMRGSIYAKLLAAVFPEDQSKFFAFLRDVRFIGVLMH